MALAGIPPWEAVGPLDFLQAAQGGARLGIERAGQTLGAEEAANRLGLSYAQLASENARTSAAQQAEQQRAAAADALRRSEMQTSLGQWMQEMDLRRQQAGALDQYRGGELASRSLRDALALATAKQKLSPTAKPEPEVRLYTGPDGSQIPYMVDKVTGRGTWLPSGFMRKPDATSGLTPRFIAEQKVRDLNKEKDRLTKQLTASYELTSKAQRNPNGPEAQQLKGIQSQIDDVQKQIDQLLTVPTPAAIGGGGAANTLSAPARAQIDPNNPLGIPPEILTPTNAPAQ